MPKFAPEAAPAEPPTPNEPWIDPPEPGGPPVVPPDPTHPLIDPPEPDDPPPRPGNPRKRWIEVPAEPPVKRPVQPAPRIGRMTDA